MALEPETNPARFARQVVTASLGRADMPELPDEEFYRQPAACFVSIKKDGQLRGCIGTLEPAQQSLGEEIIHNAQSAAFGDPRFPAITPDELPDLAFSVDVLSMPEEVEHEHQLDCKRYGVIVGCDYRRGVLLPDLEGVETVNDQLAIACQKAGIAPHEDFGVQRFMVDRYGEEGKVQG